MATVARDGEAAGEPNTWAREPALVCKPSSLDEVTVSVEIGGCHFCILGTRVCSSALRAASILLVVLCGNPVLFLSWQSSCMVVVRC
jgi:hypothetical protein